MEELRCCPFCQTRHVESAPDGVKLIEREVRPGVIAYQVRCSICKARGPLMASAAGAVRYWNRRK